MADRSPVSRWPNHFVRIIPQGGRTIAITKPESAKPLEHHEVRMDGVPVKIRRLEKALAQLLKEAAEQKEQLKKLAA